MVPIQMLAEFFNRTTMYVNNESSGIKANRSLGSKYGDEAIGRVQVKHTKESCNVVAAVTPEHKINDQPYKVVASIDVRNQKIKSAECKGCMAALGGCKHAIALIGWLHRRSEEPSPTEELCYWKKSVLATVDTSKPYHTDTEESSTYTDSEENDSDGFISEFAAESERLHVKNCHFLLHYNFKKFSSPLLHVSLHHFMIDYMEYNGIHSPNDFISFCEHKMSQSIIDKISIETMAQHKSALWRELRYGRITGSLVYEVAHCKTGNGSTINKIFGKKTLDTRHMKRGRELESKVKLALEKRLGHKITDSGLWLKSDLPIFGASPDGFGPRKEYCVEIKCPATEKSYKTCASKGVLVGKKHYAQVQLQMHITSTYKTKFCLTDPDFEHNGKIEIIDVNYDKKYVLKELIDPCLKFWTEHVYDKILAIVK
ncbi:hypothetical protein HA402_014442 [Bradysia odoriphaga]|nr:hypothetical protein HA402_014442 [Bradysia odoriphaga]